MNYSQNLIFFIVYTSTWVNSDINLIKYNFNLMSAVLWLN
ncbi:hypothetical protein AS4_06900 [Acinetobacter guillouiae]|nr:hypothetical protein AS4_06900 [Acinetobacter guillouiae]